jgi:GH25 family lysozyme M1 (1,4-beta-N-acetylmuramidase)
MATLDSIASPEKSQGAGDNTITSTILSQAANDGPAKPAAPSTGDPNDRGHAAHAGGENNGLHPEPPPQPKPIDHQADGTTVGIDVSEFQNTIDWSKVQNAGVKFAFIRATDGTTIQDADFVQNWQAAEKAGVLVGPYHYFTTTSAVPTQIDNFVSTIKKVDAGNLPPVIDVEDPKQFANFTVPERVAMVQQMLTGVENATGVKPMLYMSSSFSAEVLNSAPQFDSYRLWVADYTTAAQPIVPKPWTNWDFWQHSDNGQVPGIAGGVDMDLFNGPETLLPITTPASPAASPKG